ncbi:MAG: DUF2849 domain-containing protein [Pseudomonadota bacterium]
MTETTQKKEPAKISTGGVKKGRNEGEKVVTANRLSDGMVVYRGAETWAEDLSDATVVEGDAALALLEETNGEEGEIVGPYLMDVEREGDEIVPTGRGALRENIRDHGPTIHPQFGRQASGERSHKADVLKDVYNVSV